MGGGGLAFVEANNAKFSETMKKTKDETEKTIVTKKQNPGTNNVRLVELKTFQNEQLKPSGINLSSLDLTCYFTSRDGSLVL